MKYKMDFTVEKSVQNWEVVQQSDGFADIDLWGTFKEDENNQELILRVFDEFTDEPMTEWENIPVIDNQWKTKIELQTGGPYRLEIRVWDMECWKVRSPLVYAVHHFCVGDVYIVAGQSNAIGTGHGELYESPEIGVHTLRNCKYWDLATNPMYDGRGWNSPNLAFAKRMKKALNYPIGIIPCAYGGSTISQWLPQDDGVFYKKMIEAVSGKNVKGIVWYQGESEGMCCNSENYLERFTSFVNSVRKDLNNPELPIITVQVGRHTDDFENGAELDIHYDAVREAQRQASKVLEKIYIVPSIDLGRMTDGIHNSKSSNLLLGERCARMALYKIYGKGIDPSAPDLEYAKKTDANTIELKFSGVEDTLMAYHVTDPDRLPIAVEDRNGENKIKSFSITKDTIVLNCSRDIDETTSVKCQYGRNPLNIIQDFGKQIAVLCFSNVKVENN